MKKVIALMLVVCIIFSLSACSETTDKKNFRYFPIEPEITYMSCEKSNAEVELEASRELLNDEWQTFVNELGRDVCDFLNTLGANWKYEEIKAYSCSNLNEIAGQDLIYGVYRNYSIYFYPKTLNLKESPQKLSNEKKQIVVHELIHYMQELNDVRNEKIGFMLSNENGQYAGLNVEEFFVDTLALKYMHASGFYVETISAYGYGDMAIELLELSIPNVFEYYFNYNVDGLKNEFNNLVKEHTDFKYDNPFGFWMNTADMIFVSSTVEQAMDLFFICLNSELEISAIICPKDKKEQYVEIVNKHYSNSFYENFPDEDMQYFSGLMY